MLQLFYQFLDASTAEKLRICEFEQGQTLPKASSVEEASATTTMTAMVGANTIGANVQDELVSPPPSQMETLGIDFMSQMVNSTEAEDSIFLSQANFSDFNGMNSEFY